MRGRKGHIFLLFEHKICLFLHIFMEHICSAHVKYAAYFKQHIVTSLMIGIARSSAKMKKKDE